MNEAPPRRAHPGARGALGGRAKKSLPSLFSNQLARVPSRTFGPYLSQSTKGSLVVWAAFEGNSGRFSALPLSQNGKALGSARPLGQISEALRLVAVRPSESGFVLAHTEATSAGERVSASCLSLRAEPQGALTELVTVRGRALWLDVVPSGNASLVFFASLPDEAKNAVEIGVVPIDERCQPGDRTTLVRDARAWQVVRFGDAALLGLVRSAGTSESAGGNVEALPVDAKGKPGSTIALSRDGVAEADLDAARIGDNVVFAWTDRRAIEPRVYSAVIDATSKVQVAARPLTLPEGEQALVQLVPPAYGGKTGYIAWENLSERRPPEGRVIQLSALDASGQLEGARARLEYASLDGLVPELAATRRGLAALTIARMCTKGGTCETADLAPMFVEVDRTFRAVAAEPLRLDALGGAPAEHAFNLSCTEQGCLALAALRREPAPVFAVELEARSSAFRAPIERVEANAETPRVISVEAVARLESCAGVALESAADQELLASISDFDSTTPWKKLSKPAPDGRLEPLRARIDLGRIGVNGLEPTRMSPVSLRAHSPGGVTLARGNPKSGETLLAWSGVDQGVPQVFLTVISRSGVRTLQRMLTHKKGDLGHIAAVDVGDGWIIAWTDDREGDWEVYANKVDRNLNLRGAEQRITQGSGAAADPALAFDGSTVRLVWSDARGAESARNGDIFSVALDPRDAKAQGTELRVATTRAHSFSPAVQATSSGFALAWAERGNQGEGAVAFARITREGALSAPPALLSASGAEPRSVGLTCTEDACRVAAILEKDAERWLAVASVTATSVPSSVTPVQVLLGASGASVPPVLRGDDVLFVDADSKTALVRRARIAW